MPNKRNDGLDFRPLKVAKRTFLEELEAIKIELNGLNNRVFRLELKIKRGLFK